MGIITPYAWNDNDEVISVSLSATDEKEYLIENTEPFLRYIQQPVRATGIVKKSKNRNMIRIQTFNVLSELQPEFGMHRQDGEDLYR